MMTPEKMIYENKINDLEQQLKYFTNKSKRLNNIINEVKKICKDYEKYKEQWFEEECKDALDDIHTIIRGEE